MMIGATLFSGIGAPEVAMPHWDWAWHAEIEKFPSAVLAARHPMSVNLGDINAEDFIERALKIRKPDVIVFGSPCQDFSVAGQRVGLDGARGNLALVALKIIAALGIKWVVFENVPGLLSSYSGGSIAESEVRNGAGPREADEDSDFAAFLSLVRECGYLGCYRILDAQYSGVPQRRRRIFAVFHLGDWRPAAAVLLEPASLRGDHPPSRETGQRTAGTISAGLARCSADEAKRDTIVAGTLSARSAGGGGLGTDFELDGGLTAIQTPVVPDGTVVGAVSAKWAKGTGGPAGDECYNLVAFNCKAAGSNVGFAIGDVPGPLRGDGNGGGHAAIAFQPRIGRNGRGYEVELSPALNGADAGTTSDMRPCVAFKPSHYTRGKDGAPSDIVPALSVEADRGDQEAVLLDRMAVRRLTPRECERLQGYDDDYTLIQFRGKDAADGPRYKALGNSMNVKDIRWVLQRIEEFEGAKQ